MGDAYDGSVASPCLAFDIKFLVDISCIWFVIYRSLDSTITIDIIDLF